MARAARQPEALLSWMESLSDPTRLRLLRLLERHELGVAELCDVLQLPQSTVSRHLKVLGDEGWVRSRAEGTTRLYRMVEERDGTPRRLWAIAREETASWATVDQDQLRLTRRLASRRPAAEAFFAGAAGEWDRLRQELYGSVFTQTALLSLLPPRMGRGGPGLRDGADRRRPGAPRPRRRGCGPVVGHAAGRAEADRGSAERGPAAGEPRGAAHRGRERGRRAADPGAHVRRGPAPGPPRDGSHPAPRRPGRRRGPAAPRPRGVPEADGAGRARVRAEPPGRSAPRGGAQGRRRAVPWRPSRRRRAPRSSWPRDRGRGE